LCKAYVCISAQNPNCYTYHEPVNCHGTSDNAYSAFTKDPEPSAEPTGQPTGSPSVIPTSQPSITPAPPDPMELVLGKCWIIGHLTFVGWVAMRFINI